MATRKTPAAKSLKTLVNVSTPRRPVDLHTGRVLAPGEDARVEVTQHELDHIAAGLLAERPTPKRGE